MTLDFSNIVAEEDLTEEERKAAWRIGYECMDCGFDERARPIQIDQRQLIMLIHHLTKDK